MNCLVNRGKADQHWNMEQQVAQFEGPEFNAESTAELENDERKKGPKIKMNEVVSQGIGEPRSLVGHEGIRNGRENNPDRCPKPEKQQGDTPFSASFEVVHEQVRN